MSSETGSVPPPKTPGEVRHDLVTPLNHIIGFSEMLEEDAKDAGETARAQDLRRISDAAFRMLGMIDQFFGSTTQQIVIDSPAPLPQAVQETEEPAEDVRAVLTGTILVVDDNPDNRDVLTRRLERQGHRVAVAANGKAALTMAATGTYDLILLDLIMPDMDGRDVLSQLKSDPAHRDIPVIVISALDDIQSVVRCIELGAEDYLPKPFDPILLRARIGASLEKKRLRDHEVDYLNNVARVADAAAAVEAQTFAPESLDTVATRDDALGGLARVFQRMARQIYSREQVLRQQVQELRIEIDEARKARDVAQITNSEYFQSLRQRTRDLKARGEQGG